MEAANLRIETGVCDKRYYKTGHAMEKGSGVRDDYLQVVFEQSFESPPSIQYGIVYLDTSKEACLRVSLKLQEVTASFATFKFSTWVDSKVYGVSFSWMAIGS